MLKIIVTAITFSLLLEGCITVDMRPNSKKSGTANNTKKTDTSTEKKLTPEENLKAGNKYAKDGLYREAIQKFQLVVHSDTKNPEANRNLGIVYVKTGQYDKAIKYLSIAIEKLPRNFEANYYLAEAKRTQDKYDEAIFHYKTALEIEPKNTQTMKALAWSYFQIRYYKAAFEIAKNLKSQVKNDVQVDIILARILDRMGRPKAALKTLQRALTYTESSQLPYLKSVLGDVFMRAGNCKKAKDIYQDALKKQPLLAGALLGLGKCLIKEGGRDELARSYLESAVRIKPKLVEAYYLLGKSYEKIDLKKSARYYAIFGKNAAGDPTFLDQVATTRRRIGLIKRKIDSKTSDNN